MTRGDLITAVFPGDYGKPRPALVVQTDSLVDLGSVLLCPLTSDLEPLGPTRAQIEPDAGNGLRSVSLIMVDKLTALSRRRCGERIGGVDAETMEQVDGLLLFTLGLLD